MVCFHHFVTAVNFPSKCLFKAHCGVVHLLFSWPKKEPLINFSISLFAGGDEKEFFPLGVLFQIGDRKQSTLFSIEVENVNTFFLELIEVLNKSLYISFPRSYCKAYSLSQVTLCDFLYTERLLATCFVYWISVITCSRYLSRVFENPKNKTKRMGV